MANSTKGKLAKGLDSGDGGGGGKNVQRKV